MSVMIVTLLVCLALFGVPATAAAYIGPGAGLSVIGTVLAFVSAVVFMVIGFVWYPVKRLLAALRNHRDRDGSKAPVL
jgi:hypothetical protein